MNLPRYTRKDLQIMAVILPLIVVFINVLLFNERFFLEPRLLFGSGLLVLIIMAAAWFGFTWIAVTVRNRLPQASQRLQRLGVTIVLIAIVQALVITFFFRGYSYLRLFGYELNESKYYWALSVIFFLNILTTLIHEGLDSFERWKATVVETEQLKKAYMESQLLGLKSQVNPHFLFNSLNSLSSLIVEDEDKAERFLNELTKVYRYLLRGNDEQLVSLETELQFIQSFFYLIKARYGDSISLKITVPESKYNKFVFPFVLQTLFEYGFNANSLSRDKPLKFVIGVEDGHLAISNNLQLKHQSVQPSEAAFDNLKEKYKLVCNEEPEKICVDNVCTIRVPLLSENIPQPV